MPESATPESSDSDLATTKFRKEPIPLASEPKQYRAIGLVRGRYRPADELTRGTLTADDGTEIDAVLLGRVISLIKNHLDLERSYLWVVYPRTRQEPGSLHVQIAGVWEPALLHNPESEAEADEAEPTVPEQMLQDGYFSIRGEAIHYSQEEEQVIIKVYQTPRKPEERRRFFKIHLNGVFPNDRPLGRFWDIHAMLDGITLTVQEAEDIGIILKKGRKKGGKFGGAGGKKRRAPQGQAPVRSDGSVPAGASPKPAPASARANRVSGERT